MKRFCIGIVLASSASAWGSAAASDSPEPPSQELEVIAAEVPKAETGLEADHATGDWGGLRTRLVDRGVHFYAGYAGEVLGNVSGGIRRGAVYQGLIELNLELDSAKLGLWEGGSARANAISPHGSSPSGKLIGDVLTSSNIDAYDSFRLYEVWYEQKLWREMFSIRAGQLVADEEFAFTDSGSGFLNSAFGWPAFISGNVINTGPAFFVATPGARLRLDASEQLYFQAGVFDGDSFDSADGNPRVNRSGARIHVAPEQGLFALGEAGWRWNAGDDARGLPGVVKAGAWLHTGRFASHYRDEQGGELARSGLPARQHGESFGAYAAVEQMAWRENGADDQGLWLFARAGGAPRDRALFEFVADFGLSVVGPLPGRDADVLGLGFVHARFSRDMRAFERLDAEVNGTNYEGFSDHESVLEAFYNFEIRKWWSIQPDVQWIFNPGGTSAGSDAVVLGLRTTLVF